jgi:hypothetical protein
MNGSKLNDQYLKHVGYTDTNAAISAFFSHETAVFIQQKILELLREFYPAGVIVPIERIIDIMNQVYEAYRPSTGDIMTRYVIASDENSNCVDEMINQVIQIIVPQVKDNLLMDQRNSQLSIWSSLYGTFNEQGLRQHAPIKTRERRPQTMLFNMNY